MHNPTTTGHTAQQDGLSIHRNTHWQSTNGVGIAIFEDEFMANIVLPNGATVSQFMLPQIKEAYEKGSMPKMLPDLCGSES
ncbi:hypothetical protein [Neptunomonas sp. XY-337]|uniref:hypothetical protein n=1 Tax=Neptunomonas sp. XY-337 TaxID=2561897 RepID=UPI0010AA9BE2|nr:hypothetical protein [Neptunomonas sp. XY-337]